MLRSQPTHFARAIAGLPADVVAHIDLLQADSEQLDQLTSFSDPGEGVRAITLLSVTMIRGCATDYILGSPQACELIELMGDLVERFGDAIAYRQQREPLT